MNNNTFPIQNSIKVKILPVKQPIGIFYVGVANAKDVVAICTANERRKDKLEEYIGIQRPLNPKRVQEIKKYVTTWDASFPNSIILAINPEYYLIKGDSIYIIKDKLSANIIDGQHRLAGFGDNSPEDFDVILTLFPDLEFEEQAYLFSVINTKMTRINPSLAKDLFEFSSVFSPEKLAHNIAKTFNQDTANPWASKIKMLGHKEENQDPVISQSTFTKEIINLIMENEDSYEIRDKLLRSKNNRKVLKDFYDDKKKEKLILFDAYVESEDKFIYTVLKDYFTSIYNSFHEPWNDPNKILTKTTGYIAMMKIFKLLFKVGLEEGELTRKFFDKYFRKAKTSKHLREFTSTNYTPGSIGEKNLKDDFLKAMSLDID